MADELNLPMDSRLASKRMMTQCVYGTINPQQIIIELIGGGVAERYPDLHFGLIEFNAHWLASLVGAMDKAWVTGHRPGRRLVARLLGRVTARERPAADGADVRREPEVAVPAATERVRAAPVPRLVPGRSRRGRVPARHRVVDDRVGLRLPARRRNVPRQPGADRDAVRRRPRRRARRDARRHARAGSWASTPQ